MSSTVPVGAVVAGDPRQVVEAEVVLRRRRVAPVRLEQADAVGVGVGPEALRRRGAGRCRSTRRGSGGPWRVRHRQVAGQQVEQRRDVGRALDAGVPAQRHDAAAGAADVAEQQLQDRAGADVLHADAVLGPAHRVDQRGGALAAGVARPGLGHLEERLRGDAADARHHLRGVAGEVPLQDLEDAARVLEGLVALGMAVHADAVRLVLERAGGLPLHRVVLALLAVGLLPRVLPAAAGRRCASPGRSRRTARRGPRCPGSRR